MQIPVALNRTVAGKVKPGDPTWFRYNCQFQPAGVTIAQLQDHICQGFAFTAVHQHLRRFRDSQWSSYRVAENFHQGQHIGVDFDGSSFDAIARIPFVANSASFAYTTTSHTDEDPRCRVVFILSEAITNVVDYRALISGVLFTVGGGADAACSDPLRIFFGSSGCRFLDFNQQLDLETAQGQAELAAGARAAGANLARGQTPWELITAALDAIEAQPRTVNGKWRYPLPYATWRNIIWSVASEYDGAQAVSYLEAWSPCRRRGEVAALMQQADGSVGIGSLFHSARTVAGWQMPSAFSLVTWEEES